MALPEWMPNLGKLVTLRRDSVVGAKPGGITTAEEKGDAEIRVMAWGPDDLREATMDADEALALVGTVPVVWIDIVGVHDGDLLTQVGERLHLHPLALEDAQHVHQRPKAESYDEHEFVVLRLIDVASSFATEQVSLFLCDGVVITVQETARDCFEPVRRRIRTAHSRLRQRGPDYLAYALIDAVVDHLFPVLEEYGDQLEVLEERLLVTPSPTALAELHGIRRELLAVRKATWPLREAIAQLYREERPRITPETRVFLRDAYDHAVQVIDVVESFREMAAGLVDLYLSSVSNRMNDVMKFLTIITTVFVPLGFIAGLYGMNFDTSSPANMPELRWRYGYAMVLGVMGATALGLLAFFWRRGWLGSRKDGDS